jgi:hypothetical protein
MAVHAIQPGEHSVARPLPEPLRTHKVSQLSQLSRISHSTDALTRALEDWLAEIKLRYTIGGE